MGSLGRLLTANFRLAPSSTCKWWQALSVTYAMGAQTILMLDTKSFRQTCANR